MKAQVNTTTSKPSNVTSTPQFDPRNFRTSQSPTRPKVGGGTTTPQPSKKVQAVKSSGNGNKQESKGVSGVTGKPTASTRKTGAKGNPASKQTSVNKASSGTTQKFNGATRKPTGTSRKQPTSNGKPQAASGKPSANVITNSGTTIKPTTIKPKAG